MIPRRVKLKGFLCYRDEQEVSFDGSSLWMLAGLNGSGKSTVFDALTFALFGHHRGGSQQVTELINKDSNSLQVEFDFTLDGRPYQIRRTVRRTPRSVASTQQILERATNADGSPGDWQPIEGRHMRTAFDEWVKEHVGLNYDTFTSSVLLLQGRAEKLLDSSPKGRSEVLAGIVDLERYQKLHERSDARRKTLKGQLEAVQNQLAALPEVLPEQLLIAAGRIEDALEASRLAEEECNRLRERETQAGKWHDVRGRLESARRRLQHARDLLERAAEVERDFRRYSELREVLPHIVNILQQRTRMRESETETRRLETVQETASATFATRGQEIERARTARRALERRLATAEQRAEVVIQSLRVLDVALSHVKLLEQQQTEAQRLTNLIAELPARPFEAVQKATREIEEIGEIARIVPSLSRLHAARIELLAARRQLVDATRRETEIGELGKRLKAELDTLTTRSEAADTAASQADERVAETRTTAKAAKAALEDIRTLDGSSNCRACGQPLTPEHLRAEKSRRKKEADAADRLQREATAAQKRAKQESIQLQASRQALEKQVVDARVEYRAASEEKKHVAGTVQRLISECVESWDGVPEETQAAHRQLADWGPDAWPSESELDALRQRASTIKSARRNFETASKVQEKFSFLTGQLETVNRSLGETRSQLTEEASTVRGRYATAQAEDGSLRSEIAGLKADLQRSEQQIERLTREQADAHRAVTEVEAGLRMQEQVRIMGREVLERTRRLLPDTWRAQADTAGYADHSVWQAELETLRDSDTEARHEQLQNARHGQESLRQAVTELELEAEAFPPAWRVDPAEVRKLLSAALARHDAARKEHALAERQQQTLNEQARQREQLREQAAEAEREHNYHTLLTQLLGRDRLQRHLVRQAERQIVDHANAVLDRLSSGQLSLRLVGTDDGTGADRALELEAYNRATGGQPINVAFLSGSQRFRVAVSLALGIGQFANRRHRPIESVIIDEGFGCLDRNGRQVMIQELQNLRGHLHCILLVSHQEEFAEAFADGYQFELQDGTTRVNRVQR